MNQDEPMRSVSIVAGERLATHLGNAMIFLDMQSGVYFEMNETAAAVWQFLENAPEKIATVPSIQKQVQDEFAVDPDACAKDLDVLLHQLKDQGFVEIR